MGVQAGHFPSVNNDLFIAVVKADKKNPDVVTVNASDLARKLENLWKEGLRDFLKSEKILKMIVVFL